MDHSINVMVFLVLLYVVALIGCVNGRRALPPLPMKDGCFRVSPELDVFTRMGEAVILTWPKLQATLRVRRLTSATATYTFSKSGGTGGGAYGTEGRVQQHDRQLWLLPAQASDSGEYTCIYRNESYCIAGSITLHVYESSSIDMDKLHYPWSAAAGQSVTLTCPSLDHFNRTDHIEWFKEPSVTALQLRAADGAEHMNISEFNQSQQGKQMTISEVSQSQQGLYTCRLTALINNQRYNVSRTIRLHVQGTDPIMQTSRPTTVLSMTSDPKLPTRGGHSTVGNPIMRPPRIVSPENGTVFEGALGSGVELYCKVLTECHTAHAAVVTWFVNGQSVESSHRNGWGMQEERRVSSLSGACQVDVRLVVMALTEEDTRTELKCVVVHPGGELESVVLLRLEDTMFTWLVVAMVGLSCVLTVVSVFLYALLKPKRKTDYFLARQNSVF